MNLNIDLELDSSNPKHQMLVYFVTVMFVYGISSFIGDVIGLLSR